MNIIKKLTVLGLTVVTVAQAVTYTNTGRATPIDRISGPFLASKSSTTSNVIMNTIRPFYMHFEYGVVGLI